MKHSVKNILFQFFILLLVTQTLNLSLSSLDFYTSNKISNSLEDQDYVDSMVEFVVENVLGFSKYTFHDKANADNFSKQLQNNIHFDLKWLPGSALFTDNHETEKDIVNIVPKNDKIINLYFKEVPAKPPQILSV
jgi:dsDNA-binding SOS-regulon protein